MSNTKAYSREDHLQLRQASIAFVANYFLSTGYYEAPDPPIEQNHGSNVFYLINKQTKARVWVSYERKNGWKTTGTFPFSTLDIPTRKNDIGNVHAVVNEGINTLALVSSSDVLSSPTKTKDTTHTLNEEFRAVPLEKVKILTLAFNVVKPIQETPKPSKTLFD